MKLLIVVPRVYDLDLASIWVVGYSNCVHIVLTTWNSNSNGKAIEYSSPKKQCFLNTLLHLTCWHEVPISFHSPQSLVPGSVLLFHQAACNQRWEFIKRRRKQESNQDLDQEKKASFKILLFVLLFSEINVILDRTNKVIWEVASREKKLFD